MLIPKPAKVHFWFSFSSLIFVNFNAFFKFFGKKIMKQACSHSGFLNFENCLSITLRALEQKQMAAHIYICIYTGCGLLRAPASCFYPSVLNTHAISKI